ncbi:MAG: hypothetical protein ACI3VN_00965 [Candidatus Onthomonas sp.]
MFKKKQTTNAQDDLSNLSLRRRQEVEEQREKARKGRIYAVIAVITAILVAALLIWDSGVIQRNAPAYTVGSQSYSVTDVDYYFFNEYNNIAAYASYYGLDTSISLKEQEISEGQTWYDYLLDNALASLSDVSALTTAAKAEGYKLSEEGQANVDSTIESVRSAAEQYGLTESTYLTYAYGRYMTPSAFKKAVTEYYLAQDYASYKIENFEITEEDLNSYYAENAATLDTFDYEAYLLTIGLQTQYDDDGNAIDFDVDELAAAQETLKEQADQLKAAMEAGDDEQVASIVAETGANDLSNLSSSSLSYYPFGIWLSDEGRTAGEVGKVEDTRTNSSDEEYLYGYYVVQFNGRTLDEYKGVDFYNLLIQADKLDSDDDSASSEVQYDWDAALEEIQGLEQQWQDNGGDADSFLAMAEENTDGSTTSYTNVAKDVQNTEVNEWLFGSEHQVGDYEIIRDETLHGYRLVYFNGYSDLYYWQTVAKNALQQERYQEWLTSAEENQETSSNFLMDYVSK